MRERLERDIYAAEAALPSLGWRTATGSFAVEEITVRRAIALQLVDRAGRFDICDSAYDMSLRLRLIAVLRGLPGFSARMFLPACAASLPTRGA